MYNQVISSCPSAMRKDDFMRNDLIRLLSQKNPELLVNYIDSLNSRRFSLVTLVDTLSPLLVMESNLTFGSFHLIKMSLFLRQMSHRGLLSRETEIALAKVIVQHLYYLEWTMLDVSSHAHAPDPIEQPVDHMLIEIEQGNAHNAFFYASIALQSDKAKLLNTLLLNGTTSVPDTLGHSISCFFPVLQDLVDMDHPAAGTALLSYIMYLCRYRQKSLPENQANQKLTDPDKAALLRQAASGTSIVDIHHMITLYIYRAWEKAAWQTGDPLPWRLFSDWMGHKAVDQSRLDQAARSDTVELPGNYEQLRQIFSEKNEQSTITAALSLLANNWQQACDWLFRIYADSYTPDWDPHYITSLYAALELYCDESIDKTSSKMAIIQALSYYIENI